MSLYNTFSSTLPDFQSFMKKLNAMDEKQNEAMRKGLSKGADIVLDEQQCLISGKSKRLKNAVRKSKLTVTKKNNISYSTGYFDDVFTEDADGFNAGVVGTMYEYGRPGKSDSRRQSLTMKQTRNGKEVEVKKGSVAPVPHIRRGFDNKLEAAANACMDTVSDALEKEWNK